MASSSSSTMRLQVVDAAGSCVAGVSKHYDVFLSHRGPDTKNNFAGFLYKDLKVAGLEPFFDIKGGIEKGEDSWESIENAIKKVPIALVIFSENFTGSKWCLKELHLMLETPSVKLLPIFYKVKPSNLRHLEDGQLGVGFKKLQENGCGEEELESWRVDLEKASTIGGWEIEDKTVQADVVFDIVQRVCDMSKELLVCNVSGEHDKVGVNQVAQQIIKTLDEKKNTMMLALWGMGGIGKTTLARELFYLLSKRYASSYHVKNITEKVSRPDGVEGVQKHILESLCKGIDVGDIHDAEEGRRLLEGRLSKKSPILLILDDVSAEKDMVKYIITPKMLEGGSMCIVTTRDEGVLKEFGKGDGEGVYVHAMRTLSNEDSQQVFASYAFGGDCKVERKFEALVEGISKACGGVPLVLEVIGSCLKGIDDVDAWEEMKGSLKDSVDVLMDHKPIYNRLWRSYDTLSAIQREMFLDIACGLIGESVDLARRVWKSLKWCPAINFPILVRRALVSVNDEGRFVMHDVLRDMGHTIELSKKDAERARLWMPESLAKLEKKALPKHLQVLVIKYEIRNDMETFDASHMEELRILLMVTSVIVSAIPANLRWFSFGKPTLYDDFVSLCEIPQDNKLVVLNYHYLRACSMLCKQGHEPSCFALGLGGLTALECLNLKHCRMSELPSLHQLTKLEELDISWSRIQVVLGLDHMLALVKFYASFGGVLGLPDMGKLPSLRILHLPYGLRAIPGLSKIMPSLSDLRISGEALETLGVVCGNELHTLDTHFISRKSGFPARVNSAKLKSLTIQGSGSKKLDALLGLTNLENIRLICCDLEDASFLNHLTSLRSIYIRSCLILSQLPDLLELTRLEILDICMCMALIEWRSLSTSLSRSLSRSLSLSKIALPSLQSLSFTSVGIEKLQERVELRFPQLTLVVDIDSSDRYLGQGYRHQHYRHQHWKRLSVEPETFL